MSAKGLEKVILAASKSLGRLENSIDTAFYGEGTKKGIYDIIRALNEIDICNIVNFFLSKVKFDFKKNPDLKKKFESLKTKAAQLNEILIKYTAFTTISNVARTVDTVKNILPSNKDRAQEKQKIVNITREFLNSPELKELTSGDFSKFPGINKMKSTVEDITGTFKSYESIGDIKSNDLQKIVNKIYDLQLILGAISSLNSAQGLVNLFSLQDEIQKIQKFINPAKIIPSVKKILQVTRNIHQAGLQVLKVISFIKLIVKILVTIVKVFKIILKLFTTLPLPLLYVTHSIVATLENAKETIKQNTGNFRKRLSQIDILLGIIYDFILSILEKTELIIRELEILLLNLQACEQTKDLPIIDEIKISLNNIKKTEGQLKHFAKLYIDTKNKVNDELKVGQYTIRVIDEELVDEGRNLKRRRAIAFDDRGLVIAEGDLTFATATSVLIEELRLKLIKTGKVNPATSILTAEESTTLSNLSVILEIDTELEFDSVEELDIATVAEAQNEINDFAKGLKGGRKLKKKARKLIEKRMKSLREDISKETTDNVGTNTVNSIERSSNSATSSPKILSDSERERLKKVVLNAKYDRSPSSIAAAEEAKKKLEEDANARDELETG